MKLRKITQVVSVSFTLLLASTNLLATQIIQPITPEYNFKWAGFYVGAGAGMGAWTANSRALEDGVAITANQIQGGYGGFGTLLGGYDYEFPNAVVLGGFIDGTLGNAQGSMLEPGLVGNLSENGSWEIGARLGQVINPFTLPYISAGYSHAYFSKSNLNLAIAAAPRTGLSTAAFSVGGGFIGAGLEIKIDSHWSIKGEYRFAAYSAAHPAFSGDVGGIPVGDGVAMSVKPVIQTAQAVVVYKI